MRNRIAAGEVIERPASVVKELIENALDASSQRIDVETVRAGRRLIRVSDNGTGMDREDVLMAAQRYATSKLSCFEDIYALSSFGFRGEALSSIAAVSKMGLMSSPGSVACSRESGLFPEGMVGPGVSLDIVAGHVREVRERPSLGTTVEVRELFFNTPARLKFLRSEQTENHHIMDVVIRQALGSHHIAFSLVMDGKEVLSLPAAGSCLERIAQVFGTQFSSELLQISEHSGAMGATVFLGKPGLARASRTHQYIFVNRRSVKDVVVSHAVYRACEGHIARERHPVFFVFLEIDPRGLDVNVHPTKREVRFGDARAVKDLIFTAARRALKNVFTTATCEVTDHSVPGKTSIDLQEDRIPLEPGALLADRISDRIAAQYGHTVPSVYLGDTFVAVATPEGLSIVDYHAAHERVNYEKLLRHSREAVFRLLFPQHVRLDPGSHQILMRNKTLLASVGIDIDDFGHDSIVVRGLPDIVRDSDVAVLLNDVASSLSVSASGDGTDEGASVCDETDRTADDTMGLIESRRKAVAARLACHASIRGREIPDGTRLSILLRDLEASDNPAQCPHGRPTRISFSLSQLRRMFRKN